MNDCRTCKYSVVCEDAYTVRSNGCKERSDENNDCRVPAVPAADVDVLD